ncbi:hypothetical protein O6H91_23G022300 [Diphasiastrum complanatum]|uniref:Uncharacterized protein n=1 Tax=Diphasiastrum complanatum TaxID=34168 RepID=A0ACC2AA88_DIPCM|nr:hypothetical protein O6H91_23G022300 [Diphasiastrum complanatum]
MRNLCTCASYSLSRPTLGLSHLHHHNRLELLLPARHSPLHFTSTIVLATPTAAFTHRQSIARASSKLGAAGMSKGSDGASIADSIQQPVGVLFVCWGNICRSPAAEAVFYTILQKRGLLSKFKIDSAGTIDYHEGNPADARMRAAASKRGVQVTSISRPIQPSDFENFDYILAMDKKNKEDILKAYKIWSSRKEFPADAKQKVRMMCSYCKNHNETEVPDPYYGGPAGFEMVLDLLEDACEGFLDAILANPAEQINASTL